MDRRDITSWQKNKRKKKCFCPRYCISKCVALFKFLFLIRLKAFSTAQPNSNWLICQETLQWRWCEIIACKIKLRFRVECVIFRYNCLFRQFIRSLKYTNRDLNQVNIRLKHVMDESLIICLLGLYNISLRRPLFAAQVLLHLRTPHRAGPQESVSGRGARQLAGASPLRGILQRRTRRIWLWKVEPALWTAGRYKGPFDFLKCIEF